MGQLLRDLQELPIRYNFKNCKKSFELNFRYLLEIFLYHGLISFSVLLEV